MQQVAQGLASLGRNNDSMLVHMTPGEVKGLQQLAMAHGGSLTINPQTGLPEAGFLSKMLPSVLGIAAGAITMNPMIGAAVAGGLTMATGGSLMQGLVAGFGAYTGTGTMEGLTASGEKLLTAEAVQKAALDPGLAASGNVGPQFAGTGYGGLTPGQEASYFDKLAAGAKSAVSSPSSFLSAVPTGEGSTGFSNKTNLMGLGAAGLMAASDAGSNTAGPLAIGEKPLDPYEQRLAKYHLAPDFKPYTAPQPNPYYKPVYAAAGGSMQDIQANAQPVMPSNQMIGGSAPNENQFYPGANIAHGGASSAPQAPAATDVVGGYDQKLDQYTGEPVRMAGGGYTGQIGSMIQQNPQLFGPSAAPTQSVPSDYVFDPQSQQYVKRGAAQAPAQAPTQMAAGGLAFAAGGMPKAPVVLPQHPDIPAVGIFRDPDIDTANKPADEAARIKMEKRFKGAGIKPVTMAKTNVKGLGDIGGATGGDTSDFVAGGLSNLGGYSDGGRMLKGPGDGMSDSIPASINNKQPARLADGEFVVPADVVSHLGNGSTDAGAKRLYSMMDKIRKARTGRKKQGKQINPDHFMPA